MQAGRIGDPLFRKEDRRLITGRGRFSDDTTFPDVAYAVFLRSPHAHARIVSIDATAAKAMPGVLAIYCGADVIADQLRPIPHATGSSKTGSDMPLAHKDGSERLTTPQNLLPCDRVLFVGEAVAMVIAESVAEGRDAVEAIEVGWDPLPSVVRAVDALAPGAPVLWPGLVPHNLTLKAELGDASKTNAAFEAAAYRVELTTWVQRVTGVHMEPRAVTATWSEADGYVVHASHGIGVVQLRNDIAAILNAPAERVRVIAPPDVGGNFGTRNATYPEFGLAAWAARKLRRAIAYRADRSEAFTSDFQGRDLHVAAELAMDADGNFLAFRSVNTSNQGGYTTSFVAMNKGSQMMTSLYRFPAGHVTVQGVVTNTPATIPYRSAGRPEAIYVIERLVDRAARQCGFDRVALRRRNVIREAEQPFRNPFGVTYDNGAYEQVMQTALDLADWDNFEQRRAASRRAGKYRGISVGNYIETAGGFPRERAEITVHPEGVVDVILGTQNTGQGHETSFTQVVAEWLGVEHDCVRLRTGDTNFVKAGGGSHSGRSMRFGSLVMHKASKQIIERGRRIAAALFGVEGNLVGFDGERFRVQGTNEALTVFDIARLSQDEEARLPPELRGSLLAVVDQVTPGLSYPYGTATCELEIDPETGAIEILRYVSVDDVGRAINPLILHGQAHGGIVQGAGQALMEQCFFDPESGQNLSASMMDYAMPRAIDFPFFTAALSEVPASSHPLGLRPGGEGGTTPALSTIVNAVLDALWELGVTDIQMPVTPYRIWQAIHAARGASNEI